MGAWGLPVDVMICGQTFAIRSDFRAVLDALAALNDESMTEWERMIASLKIFYPSWPSLSDTNEAFRQAMLFVNLGKPQQESHQKKPKLVDWEKDVELIAPSVDKVLGYSCRRCEYLHWWEFIGAFYSVGDGLFAQVVNIRNKRAKGKKLEKHEQEFARENADLIRMDSNRLTQAEIDYLKGLGVM